ncbi:MAG: DUF4115 domain-containing protein [Massilia sp.]|nr:DUF4115 domain-containing protein [Massilia sp.]
MSAEWAEQQAADNHGVPGKTLAAQREAMGWTVEQVADQLKLAVRQVIALEQGDYANLPGPAVVRGFVRAYAKVVKLDAAPLVAQIALDTPAPSDATLTTVRRDKPASFSQVRYPSNGKRSRKLPLGLIAAVIVIAGALAGAWYYGLIPRAVTGGAAVVASPGSTAAQDHVSALPPPVQGAPQAAHPGAVKVEELPPVINNAVPLISVPPATPAGVPAPGAGAPAGLSPAGVAPAAGAASLPAAPAAPAAASSDALVITVREDSWIEVRPAKGKALFSRMVKGGQVETVNVTGPVTFIVGKPGAVDATLRGQPVVLPDTGGRVARVSLK